MDALTCPLCGYRFPGAESTCSRCPLVNKPCMIRCPRCGHQVFLHSDIIALARRIWGGVRRRFRRVA